MLLQTASLIPLHVERVVSQVHEIEVVSLGYEKNLIFEPQHFE